MNLVGAAGEVWLDATSAGSSGWPCGVHPAVAGGGVSGTELQFGQMEGSGMNGDSCMTM